MAYTTTNYTGSSDYSSGPYLSSCLRFTASRASGTDKNVTVSCVFTLGFGNTANSGSNQGLGYGYDIAFTGGISGSYNVIDSVTGTWQCNTNSNSTLVSGYPYTGKTPTKSKTISGTVSNWTSGSKTFSVTIYETIGNSSSGSISSRTAKYTFTVSLSCPTYFTNASVKINTSTQNINPDTTLKITWTGTNGTNNNITKYQLYYNDSVVYSGTATSYTVNAPPAKSSYNVYVKATAAYNSPTSSTIIITSNDYGTPTASLGIDSQSLKPDTTLNVTWSGTAGTSNPIQKYQLYFNNVMVYEGTDTTYIIQAPPVSSTYSLYVKAVGKNGNKVGTSPSINISTVPYAWIAINNLWKPVQSIFVCVNGVWKNYDPTDPIKVKVNSSWKGV